MAESCVYRHPVLPIPPERIVPDTLHLLLSIAKSVYKKCILRHVTTSKHEEALAQLLKSTLVLIHLCALSCNLFPSHRRPSYIRGQAEKEGDHIEGRVEQSILRWS